MKNMLDYDTDYRRTLKTLTALLRPYEQGLTVVVRQKDSFCLYTGSPVDIKSVLFAAVQIMKEGVVLTVYGTPVEMRSYYEIPERLLEFKTGDNRFTFIKLSRELRNDLKLLFSHLCKIYKSSKLQ
jgi:hypothetical protein